eukprot:CAMPEP_0197908962 /NCGR_PEP_ID=MMETSP1439-20131203/67886_1 /TAXON_ID=66791 /ORGANISM="Gonyaulax spinifera, Strain CCMP409" /LENGTH=163 /DNA_ID=CAMNT_0043530499 /DNA_START=186 /DNA_END=676 /DNA_ORIENTATION=+
MAECPEFEQIDLLDLDANPGDDSLSEEVDELVADFNEMVFQRSKDITSAGSAPPRPAAAGRGAGAKLHAREAVRQVCPSSRLQECTEQQGAGPIQPDTNAPSQQPLAVTCRPSIHPQRQVQVPRAAAFPDAGGGRGRPDRVRAATRLDGRRSRLSLCEWSTSP